MSILNGKIEQPSLVDGFMFPPYDADAKLCYNSFKKNIRESDGNFIQNTVKDIAQMSKVVSLSGDIWICDMITGKSSLEHFE